jgi:GTPase Era involved in 16S rRNA processing
MTYLDYETYQSDEKGKLDRVEVQPSSKEESSNNHSTNGNFKNQSTDKTKIVIQQFKQFFKVYDDTLPYLNLDRTIQASIEKKRVWIERLEQEEFPVAFFGSFSAGKSTMINAILGREILPENTKSTTAFPTIIKKGSEDKVSIWYINDDTKDTIWNKQCVDIGYKIDKKLTRKPEESHSSHLERVKSAISEYHNISGQIDSKPLATLEQLFEGWNNNKYQTPQKSIQLSELKDYVEGHQDSLFIDRIEVYLKDIEIPEDIVFVDLPGLNVANDRHTQFTKEYIQEKAKAFVVCMKPNSLLEGKEIEFLEETNRKDPTILQRSFWVINQWDTLNELQKQQEDANFNQKTKRFDFKINPQRFFKVSALNYFIMNVKCITNNTYYDSDKLQHQSSNFGKTLNIDLSQITPDQAKNFLLKHKEFKPFSDFYKALFNYLNTEAKDEFLVNAKSELLQIVGKLKKDLDPLWKDYDNSSDISTKIRDIEVNKRLDAFMKKLEKKVTNFTVQEGKYVGNNVWKQENTHEIEQAIKEKFSQINKAELIDKLNEGTDLKEMLSRLPSEVIETIKLTTLLRDKIVLIVENSFVQRLYKLRFELREINQDYFPDTVLKMLEDKLSKRDIVMRLNGLADSLFSEYSQILDEIGHNLEKYQGNTFKENTDAALQNYQNELIEFTKYLIDKINNNVRISIKNHAEYLKQELSQLFKDQKDIIVTQIGQRLNVDEAVSLEQQKRNTINNSYDLLVDLDKNIVTRV